MFGFRAYPTPILRPLGPFIAASAIVWLGINALQDAMLKQDVFKNDPRNPYARKQSAVEH